MQLPELAKALYQLKIKAEQDSTLRQNLLQNPNKILKLWDINIPKSYEFIVEFHENYGLYLAVNDLKHKLDTIKHEQQGSSEQQSFSDQHFLDCHHY